jgi:archaellum biogenesis ATPase FlaH
MQSSVTDMRSKGVKKLGYHRNCCTSGDITRSLSDQRDLINHEISEYFTGGCHWVLFHNVVGFKWNKAEIENVLRRLIAGIRHSTAQVAII